MISLLKVLYTMEAWPDSEPKGILTPELSMFDTLFDIYWIEFKYPTLLPYKTLHHSYWNLGIHQDLMKNCYSR